MSAIQTSPPPASSSLSQILEAIPEWKDDDKCLALFSSFKGPFSDNMENWMYKINFWYPLIIRTAFFGLLNSTSIFSFDISSLNNTFKRKGVSPLGMPTIISFQIQKRLFYPIDEYFSRSSFTNEQSLLQKYSNLIKELVWMISPFEREFPIITELPPEQTIIVLENVEKFADSLASLILRSNVDIVDSSLSYEEIVSFCHQVSQNYGIPPLTSSLDFRILFHYLKINSKVLSVFETSKDNEPVIFVKGASKSNAEITKATVLNICSLKLTFKLLEAQITKADHDQTRVNVELRQSDPDQNKPRCISLLRRRHHLMEYQNSLQQYLTNIHQILNSIRLAACTSDMTKSLQLGNNTLQQLLFRKEKKEDIDSLYLDLTEHMYKEKEYSSLLTPIPSSPFGEIDEESQLEEELDRMISEKAPIFSQESQIKKPVSEMSAMLPDKKYSPEIDALYSPKSTTSSLYSPKSMKVPALPTEAKLNPDSSLESVASILKRISMNE